MRRDDRRRPPANSSVCPRARLAPAPCDRWSQVAISPVASKLTVHSRAGAQTTRAFPLPHPGSSKASRSARTHRACTHARSRWAASSHAGETSPDGDAIAAIGPVRSVDAGSGRTCAVKAGGSLTCFSANPLSGIYDSVAVSGTSDFGGCALKSDQTVDCWGYAAHSLPQSAKFERIAAGGDYNDLMTCGITALGRIQCWGLISRSAQ